MSTFGCVSAMQVLADDPRGKVGPGVGEGVGEVVLEEVVHFLRGLEISLGVASEEESGVVEVGVVLEAGEGVEEEAAMGVVVGGAVGGEEGEVEVLGEVLELVIESGFAADRWRWISM